MKKAMVDKNHPKLSQRKQCELLGINRNRLKPKPTPTIRLEEEELARKIDLLHLEHPELGARRMSFCLEREGKRASRRKVSQLMKRMSIEAAYRRPNTSKPVSGHTIYPHLLRNVVVSGADEVWCAGITYIPMACGFAYLVAITDWKSRAVLAWWLSNTLDVRFCLEAFHETVRVAGRAPDICNTDQGSQFTCREWMGLWNLPG